MTEQYLVFVDIETTGLDPEKDDVIQIAALAVEGKSPFEIKDEKEIKILPSLEAETRLLESGFIEQSNYDRKKWLVEDAYPRAKAGMALIDFTAWLRPYTCIEMISKKGKPYSIARPAGWNVRFDIDFLMKFYKRQDRFLPLSYSGLDVMQCFMLYELLKYGKIQAKNTLLAAHQRLFGAEFKGHDALDDIRQTHKIFKEVGEFLDVRELITKEKS